MFFVKGACLFVDNFWRCRGSVNQNSVSYKVMSQQEIIETIELYPILDGKLVELLESLSPEEWSAPTIAGFWTVKDVATHILDGCYLRRLSIHRDGYFGEKPENVRSYQDLVAFLNGLNAVWVNAHKRLSPQILIGLIKIYAREVYEFFKTLEPRGRAIFPVDWAGETESENWFDIARDYTERWHHQQQIRLAVGKPGIETRELYYPVLETFMRALPHTYRNADAPTDTLLQFTIEGEAGGDWYLRKTDEGWMLQSSATETPAARTNIPQEIAWRVFTKGINKETAQSESTTEGDKNLGAEIFNMLSVMA